MLTVYGFAASGNCWKVTTILGLTGHTYRWVDVDSNAGETRTAEFLARNPNGKVPVVELADGQVISESCAILCHFAEGTRWLPAPERICIAPLPGFGAMQGGQIAPFSICRRCLKQHLAIR